MKDDRGIVGALSDLQRAGAAASAPAQQEPTSLSMAAEITGHAQTALERLHELTTYRLPSATVHRHAAAFDEVRKVLTDARNKMAGLTLTLGKEGA